MAMFEIKVSSTVIVHNVEADTVEEAVNVVIADLSTRFSANTEIVSADTLAEDITDQ